MKRYPVLAMALGLMLPFLPVQAQEEESHDLIIREIETDDGEEYEYQEEADVPRSVIVVLRDPSLMAAGMDPESAEGEAYAAYLKDVQEDLLAETARTSPKSVIEVRHTYTTLLNGFAVDADEELIAWLEGNDAVDHISVSREYALPETADDIGHVMDSLIEPVDGAYGEGMVIGIIDAGLDTDHPAFSTMPPSAAITEPVRIEGMHAEGNTFKSLKIPFAYDYAGNFGIYSRADDDVRGGVDHGTHVSGIAAGNDEEIKGVARDAQIAFFKVFPNDGETAREADIIAALEDAVLLHPDVVNMSLGEPCGFTTGINGEYDELMTAVDLTARQGIVMTVSCGNESYVGYQGINGSLPSTANPSYGTVSSPAVYPASLAIAGVDSRQTVSDCFTVGGKAICFVDPARKEETRFIHLKAPVGYVVVPGTGSESDYEGLDVKGKVVLVSRENNQFIQKQQTAAAMGAAGIIIYNHLEGLITIEIDDASIPCIVITKEEGEYLLAAKEKRITSIEEKSVFANETAGMISWFSSRGPSEDLCLKPELTAPGGHIYSALNSGMYGDMSGTSMAAPHAGAALAIVASHLEKTYGLPDAAEKVLMGSAKPIRQDDGYVSVRAQGAGLISLQNAFAAIVYADVEGGRPKLELGEVNDGQYAFDFALNAMADPVDMEIEVYIAAEEAENGRFALKPHVLSGAIGGDVSVRAEGRTQVHTTFALDQESLAYLGGFEAGSYVEGYVFCKAPDFTLSIPFLSFFGDWSKAPALDETVIHADRAVIGVTGIVSALSLKDAENESFHGVRPIAGQNPYDPAYSLTTPTAEKAVCIASNSSVTNTSRNSGIYYLSLPFIRNVERYEIDIRNTEGVSIYNKVFEGQKRKFYAPSNRFLQEVRWRPTYADGRVIPEGTKLDVVITAAIDAAHPQKNTSTSFAVYIDNTPPSLSDARLVVLPDGSRQLRFTASDNMCLAHVGLLDENGNELQGQTFYEEEHGASHACVFDVTDLPGRSFRIVLHDTTRFEKKYAMTLEEELPVLRLSPEESQADAGSETAFTAYNEAEETVDPELISWSLTGKTSAATAIRHGVLTIGRDEKAPQLTVQAKYQTLSAQAIVNVRPYCAVTVKETEGGTVSVDRREVLAGESVHVSVQTDPGYELQALTANGQPVVNGTVSVSRDAVIEAVFARIVYHVSVYTQGQGKASFASTSAYYGEEKTVVFTPQEGWQLSALTVNGEAETPVLSFAFTVRQDTEIQAVFTRRQYAVDAETTAGGKAEPAHQTVSHGDQATIRFAAQDGYQLESLTVNGRAASLNHGKYEFKVEKDTLVQVRFRMLHIEFYKGFWYENGVRQGTYDDQYGVRDTQYGGFIRGREIFDPATNAWYWLDAVYDGAVAKNKEVWMPYVFQGDHDSEGKWVRYDSEGHMVKGWYFNENGAYYYDLITGAMLKGEQYIDGVRYEFDPVTGICR
ncbi:MAG: S8 family serine peptidase [Solobacterium sp.]|nr:S8 family serine peptidase [Solobacterium sp.]